MDATFSFRFDFRRADLQQLQRLFELNFAVTEIALREKSKSELQKIRVKNNIRNILTFYIFNISLF